MKNTTKITFVVPLLVMLVIFSSSFMISSSNPIVLQDYYVSTLGNNNNTGDFEHPWRTIQKAANSINQGDTVYVRGGTYYEEVLIENKQGNQNVWITFKPYNNEEVIVDGRYISNAPGHAIFRTVSSSYIHITGFKMYNSACRGFSVNGDWTIMDYNTIFNCSSNAMLTYRSNISFQHNVLDLINSNWSGNGFGNEGISLSGSRNFDISYNTISRSGKICIDVKVGCQYGAVHHNLINTSTWPRDQFVNRSSHSGIYSDAWTERNCYIDIYNNYIYGDHGIGINCGAERNGSADHIRIFNNIIDVSYGFALGVCPWASDVPMSNISIFENTVIADNSCSLRIKADNITGNGTNGITICNNIFVSRLSPTVVRVENYLPTDNKIVLRNNLIYSYRGGHYKICWSSVSSWNETPNSSIWGENTILADPQLEGDFSLNGKSPAIDKGIMVPISYDFHGNQRDIPYDIGACEYTTSNGGGSSNGGGEEPPASPQNKKPIANASSGEPYQGFVDSEILFDGSKSYDPDGNITNWFWAFGDNTIWFGMTAPHTFSKAGTYNIKLIVTDNEGETHTDTTTCVIKQQNRPPTKPIITGPTSGTKKTIYTYTAVSTDADNDTIQYTFDWNEPLSPSSGFLPNGSNFTMNHSWAITGRHSITVTVTDNQTASSSKITTYIDAVQTGDIGYLTDDNSDGTYDTFHNDITYQNTSVSTTGSSYLIDSNADGNWEYMFDLTKGFTAFPQSKILSSDNVLFIGIFIVAIICGVIVTVVIWRKK